MKGTFKIIWTDEALQGLKQTIKQIELNWSQKEVSNFSRLLDKQIELIKENPGIYPYYDKSKDVKKCVLSKQTTLYYKVKSDTVFLLSVFDSRQDPNKLKLE